MRWSLALFTISLQFSSLALPFTKSALDYYIMAYDQQDLGNDEQALQYYLEALSLYGSSDPKSSSEILVNIGIIYFNAYSYERSIEFYELANRMYSPSKKYTLHNIGICYSMLRKFDRALEHFEQNLRLAQANDDQLQITKTLLEMGLIEQEFGNYDKAREYYDQVQKRTNADSNQVKLYAASLNNIGNSYVMEGNNEKGDEFLSATLKDFEQKNIVYHRGHILNYLGRVNYNLGEHDKALHCYQQAAQWNRNSRNKDKLFDSYAGISDAYDALNNYDSARFYSEALIKMLRTTANEIDDFEKQAISMKLEQIKTTFELDQEKQEDQNWIALTIVISTLLALIILIPVGLHFRRIRKEAID